MTVGFEVTLEKSSQNRHPIAIGCEANSSFAEAISIADCFVPRNDDTT